MSKKTIDKCGYKKLILAMFLFIFLGIIFSYRSLDAKASANLSIPEEYNSKLDENLIAYIDENVPEDAVWIESGVKSNFIQISSGQHSHKTNLSDKAKGLVYTFSSEENGEKVYYTVLDFYFTQKLKTAKDDFLEISTNDFLRPVSPGKGELLVKDKVDENWTVKKEIYTIVNLSFASVYGEQMNNKQNFSRVIMSFKAYGNPDSGDSLPSYIVNYTHQKKPSIPVFMTGIVIILLLVFPGYFYYNYCKKNKKRNNN